MKKGDPKDNPTNALEELPKQVPFNRTHPLLKMTMKTVESEKGVLRVDLTDRQIEIAQLCVGAGLTPYQRRAGYVLLWQMALRTGDTKLAIQTLKHMRAETTSLRSRKDKLKYGPQQQVQINQNFPTGAGPVVNLDNVRTQMRNAKDAPTAPGLLPPPGRGKIDEKPKGEEDE